MCPTDDDIHQPPHESSWPALQDRGSGDTDLMCLAVRGRLERTVSDAYAAQCAARGEDFATRVCIDVLECVAELTKLHLRMSDEASRCRELERETVELRLLLTDSQLSLRDARAAELQARRSAMHDGLTALPNREYFHGRLEQQLRPSGVGSSALALVFLDLDRFKDINDAHGHDVGDEVLRIVAHRLTGSIRADDVVSRLGGDEFACLIGELADRELLTHLVAKLFDAISSPMQIGNLTIRVRPSIGVAISPVHGVGSIDLLRYADAAMYRSKREKSGYAFFDPSLDMRMLEFEPDGGQARFNATRIDCRMQKPICWP